MMDALAAINTRHTPQAEPANERQIPNAAGGYGFKLGDEARIQRFLTLGVESGTYYVSERELTKDNAQVVLRVARERSQWLVERIIEVSTAGRAPRQNPAIFALAAVAGLADEEGRVAALAALPAVCRIGTHLFLFAKYVRQFRGWGRALRRAVGEGWYMMPDVDKIAYQVVKYRQREAWSHRDLLRLAHPGTAEPARRALFNWATTGGVETSRARGGHSRPVGATADDLPALVTAFERAWSIGPPNAAGEWVQLIECHPCPGRCCPTSPWPSRRCGTPSSRRGCRRQP